MATDSQDLATNDDDLATLLKDLDADQLDYIAIRRQFRRDKAACDKMGISQSTLARWKRVLPIDKIIRLMARDGLVVAEEKLRRAATQAIDVLIDDLKGKRHSLSRQNAAKDIADRVGLKEATKIDLTSKGEKLGTDADAIAEAIALLDASRETQAGESG